MTIEAGAEPAVSSEKKPFNWSKLIVYVAIGGAIGYAYDNWNVVSTQYLGMSYTCENMVTELAAIPPANALASPLVGILDRKSVSTTPERIECSGVGLYANGTRAPIAYRAWRESEQWWLQYEPA